MHSPSARAGPLFSWIKTFPCSRNNMLFIPLSFYFNFNYVFKILHFFQQLETLFLSQFIFSHPLLSTYFLWLGKFRIC
jgi:hypothetical protein